MRGAGDGGEAHDGQAGTKSGESSPTPGDAIDADAAIVRGEEPPSARIPLTRERILDAAVGFIDEFGLADLTMRRLGSLLGVEAMSLYRYVPGREELLDGVVERLVTELVDDETVATSAHDGWQDFLVRLAHGIRRIALRHPKTFPLIASRPPEAPWLRPPLRSLAWVETFLQAMRDEGFSAPATVAAYRSFTSFLLGHLLLEVSALGADIGPLDVLDDTQEGVGLERFPMVCELQGGLTEDHSAAEFEEALETLLDRLQLLRAH